MFFSFGISLLVWMETIQPTFTFLSYLEWWCHQYPWLLWTAPAFCTLPFTASTNRTHWLQNMVDRQSLTFMLEWLGSQTQQAVVLRGPGMKGAMLPQPHHYPDLQVHEASLKTLTTSCKTDPRNSLDQDESRFPVLLSLSVVSTDILFPLYFFHTANFWHFWHASREQFWLALEQGQTVKTPLIIVFSPGHTSVSEIWFSFLVQAGPGRHWRCVIS